MKHYKYYIINYLGISILDPGWFFLISLRATESLSCIARASVAWPSMSPLRLPNPSNLPTKVWSLLYPGTFSRSTTTVQQKHGHYVPTPTPWRQVIGVVRQIFHVRNFTFLFGQQTDLSNSSFASDTISESVISSQGRPNLNPGETDVLSSLIM